jgi:outer membrane protein TolC
MVSARADRIAAAVLLLLAIVPASTSAEVALSMREALSLAGENAFQVRAAEHDSTAAERGLRAAKTEWFPRIGVNGNALGFRPQDPLGFGFLQIPAEWSSVYVANFSLRYPIFTGGRRVNTIRRNREEVRAAASQLDAERLRNAYECRSAYLRLLVADRLVSAAEASVRRVESIEGDVRDRFAEGLADSVDVLETALSLSRTRRQLEKARTERRNASARLARVVGTPAGEPIVPTDGVPEPEDPSRSTMPAADVGGRPELRVLDGRVEALRHERSSVRGSYWPVINGLGGYAVVRPDLGQPGADWQQVWWAGITMSWGLNLGGQEAARSGEVLERIRSLEMMRNDLQTELVLQARVARNNIDEAYRLYELSRDEFRVAGDRYRLAEGKADAGALSVNRLVEIESEVSEAEQEFEAARLRYFLAVADYLYAIGSESLREAM